jgi:hypothetical protein
VGPEGPEGNDGTSVTVVRKSATATLTGPTSVTAACGAGEMAIGAGYTGVANGVSLVGSTIGGSDEEWVLTFSADPGTPTVTVLCAVTA